MAKKNSYVKLKNRVLCYDGDSVADLSFIYDHFLNGGRAKNLYVSKPDYESDEVQTYNKKFINDQLKYKTNFKETSTDWNLPKKYKNLDVENFIWNKLKDEVDKKNFTEDEYKERVTRIKMELRIWKKRDLLDMLRFLTYMVKVFEENKIIWGTGRGSSCASYVLYLIGLHQVDSVKYKLDLGEFFR